MRQHFELTSAPIRPLSPLWRTARSVTLCKTATNSVTALVMLRLTCSGFSRSANRVQFLFQTIEIVLITR